MGRFIKDIYLGVPTDDVEKVVQNFLYRNNFHKTQWNGESMWGSDTPFAENYRLFGYSYENGNLHLEASLRHGKTAEIDLIGWEAMTERKSYLELIVGLLQDIIALVPENSALSVERILNEKENSSLKKYRILLPIILIIAYIIIKLPKL